MTDRHAGYIVVLEHDIREDDAQRTRDAIELIKGVLSVEPVTDTIEVAIAKTRARYEFADALSDAIRSVLGFDNKDKT